MGWLPRQKGDFFLRVIHRDGHLPPFHLYWIFLLAPLLAIPIFVRFGLYHAIIRYIGFQVLWAGER